MYTLNVWSCILLHEYTTCDGSRFLIIYNRHTSSSSSWREAFSRSLPPLRSFARMVGPPL